MDYILLTNTITVLKDGGCDPFPRDPHRMGVDWELNPERTPKGSRLPARAIKGIVNFCQPNVNHVNRAERCDVYLRVRLRGAFGFVRKTFKNRTA